MRPKMNPDVMACTMIPQGGDHKPFPQQPRTRKMVGLVTRCSHHVFFRPSPFHGVAEPRLGLVTLIPSVASDQAPTG